MRKEINSKTKRKWIMGGLAAFASIAMLTTGFAVWVVGVSNKDAYNDLKVSVDTASNESISFEMKIDGTDQAIKLAESKETAGNNKDSKWIVHITDADVANKYEESPLTLQVSYTISFGADYKQDFDQIKFSIEDNPAAKENVKYCSSKVSADNIKLGHDAKNTATYKRTDENKLTYIDAPSVIDLSKVTFTKNEHNIFAYSKTENITFSWGSFFGNDASPATFYNAKVGLTDGLSKDTKDTLAVEITEELQAMHTQMDGKTIQLKAELFKAVATA